MISIAIDGACRRNGKPDCVAAGGVFVVHLDSSLKIDRTDTRTVSEFKSTSQRGELLALLTALDYVYSAQESAQIITDSEYLFNTMTKDWYTNWVNKGWITAAGTEVKNKDIWTEIISAKKHCEDRGYEVMFYHIKGHAVSFGKVTASRLLQQDRTGQRLLAAVRKRIASAAIKPETLQQLTDLSIKNNGFALDDELLARFISMNIVADAVATECVEWANSI